MLRDSAALSMQNPRPPVPIESRALGTLSYIRASIDAASSLAVPGSAGLVMGAIGTAAAVLASLPQLTDHWLLVWIVAAGIAFILGGAAMARQSGRQAALRGTALLSGPFRKFLLCLCPSLLAGAVLTLVLWQAGLERLIPGMWLLLYGCAVVSASTVTNASNLRLIVMMGGTFMVLGLVTLWLPAPAHTPAHTLALGTGFGALHLLFGILIGRASHGE